MKTRKILFEIIVSEKFVFNGLGVPQNKDNFEITRVPIDFEWDEEEDVLVPAVKALMEYVDSVYKGKIFLVLYWWWRDLPGWENDIILRDGV